MQVKLVILSPLNMAHCFGELWNFIKIRYRNSIKIGEAKSFILNLNKQTTLLMEQLSQ